MPIEVTDTIPVFGIYFRFAHIVEKGGELHIDRLPRIPGLREWGGRRRLIS